VRVSVEAAWRLPATVHGTVRLAAARSPHDQSPQPLCLPAQDRRQMLRPQDQCREVAVYGPRSLETFCCSTRLPDVRGPAQAQGHSTGQSWRALCRLLRRHEAGNAVHRCPVSCRCRKRPRVRLFIYDCYVCCPLCMMSVKSPREASSKSGNRCHSELNSTVSCVLFQCRLAAPEVLRLVHMATTTCPQGTVS
jgi:hypothetical protein